MSIDLTRLLQTLGGSLMSGAVLPQREDYQQKTALVLGLLLMIAGEEGDRLVSRLVEENAAMRRLFAQGGEVLRGTELSERLASASAGADPSLLVSDLRQENQALRALLIDLHSAVEQRGDPAAQALEAEIWAELVRSHQRRSLLLTPL